MIGELADRLISGVAGWWKTRLVDWLFGGLVGSCLECCWVDGVAWSRVTCWLVVGRLVGG